MGRFKLHKPGKSLKIDRDHLLAELANPRKLAVIMHRFEDLIRGSHHFDSIRFDPEVLLERLDEITMEHADTLNAIADPGDQRREILKHLLPGFLSRGYLDQLDSALLRFVSKNLDSNDLKAISAASLFLELHRRNPASIPENPLWDVLFAVSYDAAVARQEHVVGPATTRGERIGIPASLDSETDRELSDDTRELMASAVGFIDDGSVDLGFSLETVLQGLRLYQKLAGSESPDRIVRMLREVFPKEIKIRELDDLEWGLDVLAQNPAVADRAVFETVRRAISIPPIEHNPAVFGIYYRSIAQFFRFIKADEREWATRILTRPDDPIPVLEYGRWLLNQESPRRALKAFEAALLIDPESAWGEFGAGIALWRDESFNEARWRFGRAARKSTPACAIHNACIRMSTADDRTALIMEARDLLFKPIQ